MYRTNLITVPEKSNILFGILGACSDRNSGAPLPNSRAWGTYLSIRGVHIRPLRLEILDPAREHSADFSKWTPLGLFSFPSWHCDNHGWRWFSTACDHGPLHILCGFEAGVELYTMKFKLVTGALPSRNLRHTRTQLIPHTYATSRAAHLPDLLVRWKKYCLGSQDYAKGAAERKFRSWETRSGDREGCQNGGAKPHLSMHS